MTTAVKEVRVHAQRGRRGKMGRLIHALESEISLLQRLSHKRERSLHFVSDPKDTSIETPFGVTFALNNVQES